MASEARSLSRTDRVTPAPPENSPSHGWAVELRNAQTRNEKKPCSANRLKIAKAALVLRQWKLCQAAADEALNQGGISDEEVKQLRSILKTAQEELAKDSYLKNSSYFEETFVPRLLRWEFIVDHAFLPSHRNLNQLHQAAKGGDVRWLEALIAVGAGLNVPVDPDIPLADREPYPSTPKGCTALLLAIGMAAFYKRAQVVDPATYSKYGTIEFTYAQNCLRCAIILVMQGANLESRIERPSYSGPIPSNCTTIFFHRMDLFGLSVKELAAIIDDEELLGAIRLMEEDPTEHAWCRCGSRLSWKLCHAAPAVAGQHPHFLEERLLNNRTKVHYRLSPHAPCPCMASQKTNFECCGWMASHPRYRNDDTAKGYVEMMTNLTATTERARIFREAADTFASRAKKPQWWLGTEEDFKREALNELRSYLFRRLVSQLGPKTRMRNWDIEVYIGVIERLELVDWFRWTDTHWMIEKHELIRRVQEWNDALEVYCDDNGLIGDEREMVIRQHRASPFAPCANTACKRYETTVKQFSRCGTCKVVAYCSRACQKEHWKTHKPNCG